MLTLDRAQARLGDFRVSASFSIPTGARVSVLGPSGGGKSTLLAMIAGFQPLYAGTLAWDGKDISCLDPGARPSAILFQDNNLFPHLTAAQNVGLGIRPALRLRGVDHDRVSMALERVGLGGLESRKPGALSGGQQSRAALARILVQAKPLILLDEPFAALGPRLKSEMLDLVCQIADESGTTVVMVTHDPGDAEQLGGQTIVVSNGLANEPVDTKSLLAKPPPELQAYLK